jgi:hypothetical protein
VRFSARGILRYPTPKKIYDIVRGIRMSSCRRGDGSAVFYAQTGDLFVSTLGGATTGFDLASRSVGGGAAYAPDEFWHEEVYGRTMIYNSWVNIPQVMENSDLHFKDLPNWPADARTKLIRVYKTFLVAIGVQESTDEKDNIVWWSDACYNSGLPPNWDYTDPTSFSGQQTVGAGNGKLVDARPMGDTLIIYSERSAHSMQFTGNIQFPMQFRELFKFGCLNRDCVGVFDRRHFVIGPDHIWVHDGVNITRPAEGKVERAIYADMLDRELVKVAMNPANYEAIIYFQSAAAGNPYVYWIWNWQYDTWTRAEVVNVRHIWYGPPESNQVLWSDLQTAGTTWDGLTADKRRWSDLSGSRQQDILCELAPPAIRLVFFDYDSDTYQPFRKSRVSRVGIDLDALDGMDSGVIKFIRKIYPIMTGDDSPGNVVRFRFGASKSPDGAIAWKDWANYPVRDGWKVDTRITGRYLAFELEADAANKGGWGLTGLDIEVEPAGGR